MSPTPKLNNNHPRIIDDVHPLLKDMKLLLVTYQRPERKFKSIEVRVKLLSD